MGHPRVEISNAGTVYKVFNDKGDDVTEKGQEDLPGRMNSIETVVVANTTNSCWVYHAGRWIRIC